MGAIELRHLRTLAALDQAGSLVEAAERVGLTQSALSHQIKDLETRLGVSLLYRKTRPLRFTSAGERLVRLAHDVLPRVRSAEAELARLAAGRAGRLYLAIECHSCFDWLLPAIERFREGHPDVDLDLSGGFNFDALDALQRADLDLVVTSDPVPVAGIVKLPLFTYEAVLVMGNEHPYAGRDHVEPSDLADQTVITYPVDHRKLDLFSQFLDPAGVVPAEERHAELTPLMVHLCAGGRGVACLPNWAIAEYRDRNQVSTCSLGEEGVWPVLHAAVREEERDRAYLEAFVTIARETCFARFTGILPVLEEA
jgi:LysR family transcriptional regulator for metE and metH